MKAILRMTHQREVILDEMGRCKGHPTADALYERLKKKLPRISLATVYRNLEILSEAGMIRKLEISGRQKRFDRQLEQHHHIYCVQCHRVDNLRVETVSPESAAEIGYRISGCRIEFFGICPDCQKKNERRKPAAPADETAPADGAAKLSGRQRKVLQALNGSCCACAKDIAAAVALAPAQVSCQLTALKKKGLVASPARCQYELTAAGKELL
ncbi:MAG: Fur family transcriptional regulator [Candidatus Electronema sp. V4]|uniref:Fur family transcriptional regulator n=1 Tax=Candidatus Electronema sp. V4 TaxID=3454756 RepID=UPI0040559483